MSAADLGAGDVGAIASDPLRLRFVHFLAARPELLSDPAMAVLPDFQDAIAHPLPSEALRARLERAWTPRARWRPDEVSRTPSEARTLRQVHQVWRDDKLVGQLVIVRPDAQELLAESRARRAMLVDMASWAHRTGLSDPRGTVAQFVDELSAEALAAPTPIRFIAGAPGRAARSAGRIGSRDAVEIIDLMFHQLRVRRWAPAAPILANIWLGESGAARWIWSHPRLPISETEAHQSIALWAAINGGDESAALGAIRRSLTPESAERWDDVEYLLVTALRRGARPGPAAEDDRHALDRVLLEVLRVLAGAKSAMTGGAQAADRMLVSICAGLRQARTGVDPGPSLRRAIMRAELADGVESLSPEELAGVAADVARLVREGPERLNRILEDVADGRLETTLSESAATTRSWNARTRLVAIAIASLGPWFLLGGLVARHGWTAMSVLITAGALLLIGVWMIKLWSDAG